MSRFRETEHPARRPTRFHWAALKHPGHWVISSGLLLAALMLSATIPLMRDSAPLLGGVAGLCSLVALGWSGIWLLAVPMLPRFRRAVDAKLNAQYSADFSFELASLRQKIDKVYSAEISDITRLRDKAREILGSKFGDYDVFAKANLEKLDSLAIQYLKMLAALTEYDQYMSLVDPESIERQLNAAQAEGASASGAAADARAKTVTLLQSRLARFRKAQERLEVLKAQIQNTEATMKLLVDQAMTAPDAQSVGADIDEVLSNIASSEVLNQELSELNAQDEELFGRLAARD